MKEYMEKIDKGLEEDAKAAAEFKEKEREKMWREQEKAREELERRQREPSRDSSEEKERKKKKKRKEKSRTRSSSSSSSEDNDRKKKKKKKKAKARSGSSDSESDGDRNKKMEDELFSMVAEMTSRKKKSGSGEEVLIDLMKKMSESYSKIKKENSETAARCVILENQNKVLKRQVEDLQEKLEVSNGGRDSRKLEKESKKEKRRYASGNSDQDEFKYRPEQFPPQPVPVPAPVPSPMPPPPMSWAQEGELKYKDERFEEKDRYREDRDRYKEEKYESGRHGRDRDDRRDRRDRDRERDRYREERRRGDRSRSRSRSRDRHGGRHEDDRSKSRDKERAGKDKNEKIDLKDWTQPPDQPSADPTLLSLKEKMKAKEEEASRKEDELRSRWVTKEIEPTPPPELPKPNEQPLPENRSSIKMSWGTRKTPDPGPTTTVKSSTLVGKMPWVKNGDSSSVNGSSGSSAPRRSRFGPAVGSVGAIPPPSLVTKAPTLGT